VVVPSLRDWFPQLLSSRHCRAGLSHAVPSALLSGSSPNPVLISDYSTFGRTMSNRCVVRAY
jgi:hypothetical protein